MERNKSNLVRFAVLAALSPVRAGAGEITIDDKLPDPDPGSIVPTDKTYVIPLSRGFVKESNLFHSFSVFNVEAGEIATFTGDDQHQITNIISRVTGGGESYIDGTVKSEITGANFWFVNPAGVRIGENAYFDVSGSLAIGAADFVDFGEDLKWYAVKDGGTDVSMLSVNPQAFGFVENSDAGALHAERWRLVQGGTFDNDDVWNNSHPLKGKNVPKLGDVMLAGGSGVYISNSAIQTVAALGTTRPPGSISITSYGDIELTETLIAAVTNSASTDTPAKISIVAQHGDVTLDTVRIRGATLLSGAADAANVTILGGDVLLLGPVADDTHGQDKFECGQAACYTRVQTQTFGKSDAGVISITGTDSVVTNEVDGNFDEALDVVQITAAARRSQISAPGAAGQIFISAGTESDGDESKAAIRLNKTEVSVAHDALEGGCEGQTCAAVISIESTGELTIKHDSEVSGETNGPPSAAQIFLIGSTVELSDGVTVSSVSDTGFKVKGPTGPAGNVTISGSEIRLANTKVSARTASDRANDAVGSVTIGAANSTIKLTNAKVIVSTTGATNAGDISLRGSSIALNDRTEISAETSATGAAGNITITGGQVTSDAGSVACTVTFGCAVKISSRSASSPGMQEGPAGDVTVTGEQIRLADAEILATTESHLNTSAGGNIIIGEGDDSIELTDTIVQASTSGPSHAGDVTLTGSSIVLVAATASKLASTKVSARTSAAGAAGNVTISGSEVRTSIDAAGAQVEISSLSSARDGGPAGSVTIKGNEIDLADTLVTASTISNIADNEPGNIRIGEAGDEVELINTTVTATSGLPRGLDEPDPIPYAMARADAGDITLEGTTVTLREGTSLNAQTYALGAAGDITINGDVVTSTAGDDGDRVTISSVSDTGRSEKAPTGSAGNVTITGSEIRLANTDVSATTTSELANDAVGNVRIGAGGGSVELTDTSVAVSTSGASDAGRIRLEGSSIALNDGTAITAQTSARGAAGSITITGGVVTSMADADGEGVTISSTSGTGDTGTAGSVSIDGTEVRLVGTDISATTASTNPDNPAGNISVTAARSFSLDHATISSTSDGAGDGGNITLTFNVASTSGNAGIFEIKGTTISTTAEATQGGSITIDAGGHEMRIVDGSEIKASAGQDGDGGDVLIHQPGQTVLQRSKILAKADNGQGGRIEILPVAGALFIQDTESEISADAGVDGQDGEVEIASPDVDLSAAIQPQDVEVARPPELSASACSPSSDTSPSTFVREGRGGVVPGPDGYLTRRPDAPPNRETGNGNALPSAEPHKLIARATNLTREDGPIATECM